MFRIIIFIIQLKFNSFIFQKVCFSVFLYWIYLITIPYILFIACRNIIHHKISIINPLSIIENGIVEQLVSYIPHGSGIPAKRIFSLHISISIILPFIAWYEIWIIIINTEYIADFQMFIFYTTFNIKQFFVSQKCLMYFFSHISKHSFFIFKWIIYLIFLLWLYF